MESLPLIDDYGLQHLSYHLFRAGYARKLYALISSNTWFSASGNFDHSHQQYSQDVDFAHRSLYASIQVSLEKNVFDDLPQQLAQVTALAWLSSRLGQSAGRITSKTLEALTLLGNGSEAIRRARTIPDLVRRAESLVWIGFASNYNENHSLKEEAWSEADTSFRNAPRGFFNDFIETKAKYVLILCFTGEKQKALRAANELANDFQEIEKTAIGVTSTAQAAMVAAWAAVGELTKSAELVPKIYSIEDQMQALRDVVDIALATGISDVSPFIQMALERSQNFSEPKSYQFLGEILARTGALDQMESLLQKADINHQYRAWIYRAGAVYAHSKNDEPGIRQWVAKTINEAVQISEPLARLRLCASLIVEKYLLQPIEQLNELLDLIQKDISLIKDHLDEDTLGLCALALCFLHHKELAKDLTSQAISVTIPPDDWDETYGLILVAKRLGDILDFQRLQQVLEIANNRTDLWQRAEIVCAVTVAMLHNQKDLPPQWAQSVMEQIRHEEVGLAQRPNTFGALAVWEFLRSDDLENPEGKAFINQAVAILENDEDQASALAFLALTLAQYQFDKMALEVIELSIQTLKMEEDPNTVARVISEIVQVWMTLETGHFPTELWGIAESIPEEWSQGDAYFWLAGLQAIQGQREEAQGTFWRAFQFSGWSEIDFDAIEQAFVGTEKSDQFLSTVDSIEWPSTKAALLFAGLAIMLIDPKPWHILFGLEAINYLDEGYTEKRALILRMIATGMEKLKFDVSEYINVYLLALTYSKSRIVGEPWTVFRSFYPLIRSKGFPHLAEFVWDEWVKFNRLFY